MGTSLKEKSIVVKLSDPWDLGEKMNWEPFTAIVLSVDNNDAPENIILRFTNPFEYDNLRCEYFIASTRHVNAQLKDLLMKREEDRVIGKNIIRMES